MKIERFEDIEGWKKARELTKLIYSFTRKDQFTKDYGLKDQITRASVSVMLNIAEGFPALAKKQSHKPGLRPLREENNRSNPFF